MLVSPILHSASARTCCPSARRCCAAAAIPLRTLPCSRSNCASRGNAARTLSSVDAALTLAQRADAVVEGLRPGVMERLGLGPDTLLERNPKLVYGRMTGWGQDGFTRRTRHRLHRDARFAPVLTLAEAAAHPHAIARKGHAVRSDAKHWPTGASLPKKSTVSQLGGSGSRLKTQPARKGYAGASNEAQALATADTCSGGFDPGAVAQPPFSTKSPCDHESTFLSAARLAETSVAR